jgi:hypothetical protein
MNKLAFLLVTVALFSPAFAQESNKTQVASVRLVINGIIKNFDEFVACVVPDTYIQLVPVSTSGEIRVSPHGDVRFFYKSDLLKLSVPKKAVFSFSVPNTPPGKYFLAAQGLNSNVSSGQDPQPMFLTDKKVLFIIDVPVDAKSPFTIKAGDLIAWTH